MEAAEGSGVRQRAGASGTNERSRPTMARAGSPANEAAKKQQAATQAFATRPRLRSSHGEAAFGGLKNQTSTTEGPAAWRSVQRLGMVRRNPQHRLQCVRLPHASATSIRAYRRQVEPV